MLSYARYARPFTPRSHGGQSRQTGASLPRCAVCYMEGVARSLMSSLPCHTPCLRCSLPCHTRFYMFSTLPDIFSTCLEGKTWQNMLRITWLNPDNFWLCVSSAALCSGVSKHFILKTSSWRLHNFFVWFAANTRTMPDSCTVFSWSRSWSFDVFLHIPCSLELLSNSDSNLCCCCPSFLGWCQISENLHLLWWWEGQWCSESYVCIFSEFTTSLFQVSLHRRLAWNNSCSLLLPLTRCQQKGVECWWFCLLLIWCKGCWAVSRMLL